MAARLDKLGDVWAGLKKRGRSLTRAAVRLKSYA
jgi:hypothetical protein